MESLINLLTKVVSETFVECGYSYEYGIVSVSDRQDLCEFQCNGAFLAAKTFRKAPYIIANEVAKSLELYNMIKKIDVIAPGFINITLSDDFIMKYVTSVANDINLGIPQAEDIETIIIDYGGPNCAKPLHIGHLRTAIRGEALKRLTSATGRKAIGDVHLGDWGLPIGLVLAEISERYPNINYFNDDFNEEIVDELILTAEMLNEIYPYASSKSKENEEFKKKAQIMTAKLQSGSKGYVALWNRIIDISKEDFKTIYDKLNVHFELWYGESDSEKYIDKLVEIINDKNLLYKSNGAMVVDVQNDGDTSAIPPIIIKKSDGSNAYATTDLTTILQRQIDYNPNEIWYIVDSRQKLHFEQVFRCIKKAEIVSEITKLEHLDFGTMNGKDGKPFKTRDGGVMRLSELYDTVYEKAKERLKESEYSKIENIEDTAHKITIAAIKFGDLSNHRLKDYIFDIDKFLASKGKTGVFLLYTVARINSLLKNINYDVDKDILINEIYSGVEKELLLKIALSGEMFTNAYNEKAPNYICENAYEIAAIFSNFYNDNHIISESDVSKKENWINICLLVKKMLIKHLDILGINYVNEM